MTMARWHYVCRRRAPLFSNSLHSASAFPPPLPSPSSSIFSLLPHLPSRPRPARCAAPSRSSRYSFFPIPVLLAGPFRANCNRQSADPLSLLPLPPLAHRAPLNLAVESVDRAGGEEMEYFLFFSIPPRPLFDVHFNLCVSRSSKKTCYRAVEGRWRGDNDRWRENVRGGR